MSKVINLNATTCLIGTWYEPSYNACIGNPAVLHVLYSCVSVLCFPVIPRGSKTHSCVISQISAKWGIPRKSKLAWSSLQSFIISKLKNYNFYIFGETHRIKFCLEFLDGELFGLLFLSYLCIGKVNNCL